VKKALFSVVKFLGVVNRYGELRVVNLLLYFALFKFSIGTVAIVLAAKVMEDIVEFCRRRGLWDEMVKLQAQHNEMVKAIYKAGEESGKKWEAFERDYAETKRAVNLLNNRSVVAQMQGMTMAKKG
jgi:hypothetical protein